MPPRNKKVKSKKKKIHTPPSAFVSRGSEHIGQLADTSSGKGSVVPPSIAINATEIGQNTRDSGRRASNAGTPNATTNTRRSNTPNIGGGDNEAVDSNTMALSGSFNHAHHFVLINPTMVDNSTNMINHVAGDREVKAKKLLSKHMIQGAAHDSSARDPPPRCHPGTRISINERIMVWFYNEKKQELILWIYGPAGVGKSAIVQTLADTLATAKCLGASVFFSRPNGRNSSRSVFITIAYQLAIHIPAYCAFISERLASDPELVNKGMQEQFKTFIIEPFVEKRIGANGETWGILLDGLDELDEKRWQREIVRLVTAFALKHPNVPLIWVIASRPEPHILDTFKAKQIASSYREEYIPVDSPEACRDVERYLRSSFETIREEFPRITSEDWPKEIKLTKLAHAASGHFAFADVAVRFIRDARHADPVTRLDDVLVAIERSRVGSGEEQPFAHLDALYMCILASIPRKTWPLTQQILVAISEIPGTVLRCTKVLSIILGVELGRIYTAINDLYSILDISPDDVYSRLRFHHASFVDFLRDPSRSREFYTPFDNIGLHVWDCVTRIWLDFQKESPRGPKYDDRWHKYILQLDFDVNVFNQESTSSLFFWIHVALSGTLNSKWGLVLKKRSPEHWNQLVEILCQVENDTFSMSWPDSYDVASAWFDVWKIRHTDLSDRGVVHQIRLEHLQLNHLWWPEEDRKHSVMILDRYSSEGLRGSNTSCGINQLDEYISGLKYFQQHYPTLPVLICGNRGNRFAVFIYEYTEDDSTERPLHVGVKEELDFEEYRYQGGYCIPYSDDV